MKIKGLIIIASAIFFTTACGQTSIQNIKLETKEDSVAYAIGVSNYVGMSQQGLEIDPLIMAKGMLDAKDGNMLFNEVTADGYIQLYMQGMQEEKAKVQYADVLEEGESFLEENSRRPGVLVTGSGLQYEILTTGEGAKPVATDKVRVHYTGTLIDGTKFDSSVDRGEPSEFSVNGVISGWIEGLQLMTVGSKYKFFIPYDLAYGASGAGGTIVPFSTLVFEVELLDIITE
jgi:FKBP-type peptidyl-prolyl cis-trans isomerase FklB